MPMKPENVPGDAYWVDTDKEWEQAAKNAAGEKHGLARWWKDGGALIGQCEYRDGKAHGTCTNYHDNGETYRECRFEDGKQIGLDVMHRSTAASSQRFPFQAVANIWRSEMIWSADGRRSAYRVFSRDGIELGLDGAPLEKKPGEAAAEHPPAKPPQTREELEAEQQRCLEQLQFEHLSHEQARLFLDARGVGLPKWFPSDGPAGVRLHRGALRLEALRLDHAYLNDVAGVIIDGNAELGSLDNGELDFAPFLIVLGDMRVRNAAVAGAAIEVLGALTVSGTFHGCYNHGVTRVRGGAKVALLIADGYAFECDKKIEGLVIDTHQTIKGKVAKKNLKNPTAILHAAFVEDGDLVSDAIYAQVSCGGNVLKR